MSSKHDKPLLERAVSQIESRKGSYNGRENSFEYIARRWKLWVLHNWGIEIDVKPHHVALMMVEFKMARKEARKASGAEAHPDDDEDAAAYLQWGDMLDPDKQTTIPFEEARRKVSNK